MAHGPILNRALSSHHFLFQESLLLILYIVVLSQKYISGGAKILSNHKKNTGFGLPHTDENPYNTNLGNCLDYTDDPVDNLLPGAVNFAKLREMYLSRRRRMRRVESDGTIVETTELLAP